MDQITLNGTVYPLKPLTFGQLRDNEATVNAYTAPEDGISALEHTKRAVAVLQVALGPIDPVVFDASSPGELSQAALDTMHLTYKRPVGEGDGQAPANA